MRGPTLPDSTILPPPKSPEEIDMYNALREFMLNTTDALSWLIKHPTTSVVVDYTATSGDYTILCDATGAAFAVTLPSAIPNKNKIYVIKKIDVSVNAITVTAFGDEEIEGSATQSLASQYDTKTIHSDGTNWHILSTV